MQDNDVAEKLKVLQGKTDLQAAPPSDLLNALNEVHQSIGQGSTLLDRLMDASAAKIKEELKGKKTLVNAYTTLGEKFAMFKPESDKDPLMNHAKTSLAAAKVLIACQSCTVAEAVCGRLCLQCVCVCV